METDNIAIYNNTAEQIPLTLEEFMRLIDTISAVERRNFLVLEVVFVDDTEILELNRKYLGHDYVTDIITFPYHEGSSPVEGTLFCCITQIKRQSLELETKFETELLRVVIHGMLHLLGHDDNNGQQRENMRSLEDKYIRLYQES
jgi:probable rRNA maturation factor